MREMFAEGVPVHPPELRSPFIYRAIVLTGTCDLPTKSMAKHGWSKWLLCMPLLWAIWQNHIVREWWSCARISAVYVKILCVAKYCTPTYQSLVRQQPSPSTVVLLQKIGDADRKLLSSKPLSTITGTPWRLTERKYGNASEYCAFLFYFSLPIMMGLLPTEHFEHFIPLCHGIYILNSTTILLLVWIKPIDYFIGSTISLLHSIANDTWHWTCFNLYTLRTVFEIRVLFVHFLVMTMRTQMASRLKQFIQLIE